MKSFVTLTALLLTSWTMACDFHGKTGITIENDLWIGANDKSAAGITLDEFNKAIDDVTALYGEVVVNEGSNLKVVRNWNDGTVNAFARRTATDYEVHMFGGLARHETITADGFALVVCHELGHHLGGAPRKLDMWTGNLRWAANEGQADYWGTSKCFRKLLEKRADSVEVVSKMEVEEEVRATCEASFPASTEDAAICVRSTYAGRSLASLFHALRNLSEPLSFETKDPSVVKSTYHGHPLPQCRLDTYFSAATCTVNSSVDTDANDPNIGTCSRHHGETEGVRPLCWYQPSEFEI